MQKRPKKIRRRGGDAFSYHCFKTAPKRFLHYLLSNFNNFIQIPLNDNIDHFHVVLFLYQASIALLNFNLLTLVKHCCNQKLAISIFVLMCLSRWNMSVRWQVSELKTHWKEISRYLRPNCPPGRRCWRMPQILR